MNSFDFSHHSHRRYNPLTNSWVLCSPHRTQRPWQGKEEDSDAPARPTYDPQCYLCPNNSRANGDKKNPDYKDTFIFENDFPAVRDDQPPLDDTSEDDNPLLQVQSVRGQCHVICFTPNHAKTLAEMSESEILPVIHAWISIYKDLQSKPFINHVQIFENKGAVMGCSNPHPHGQVWATEDIPQETSQELVNMKAYQAKHHRCLLCDYVNTEKKADLAAKNISEAGAAATTATTTSNTRTPQGSRIICENDSFICVVPFWAIWPFETLIISKSHAPRLSDLSTTEQQDLANILRRITCRYDNLFRCSFPYSMGIHQSPTGDNKEFETLSHLHLHFYPPLLRSATVKKFLVGFELLAQAQRDLTPEQAAARLADCSEVHYMAS
ncbi:galactose-1-phosphate uridyl transferase [Lobosporangium transversale]|uniref:Galactose-1-phosphate uridylyltransferase n=1 Tax=Lobosporangium transversale TaxID=64571 RepID=A0A1Y2H2T7_9FUNG|nr:galactose-1-phosphate uridylyltransferase [Lobosporangium transversale]KAF9917549.1 galactose-1-phosphate uridyl transferase [Lobosporangium transversale]ORZ28013.1 galactose-1-phosphate uridylyltransferase [Lobosporangium transversale]|eukprot:XP_021885716.1 galactose-1-phosphate uridylyltransferase [Lobosporangium transversale]